jgi:hypothetical protein
VCRSLNSTKSLSEFQILSSDAASLSPALRDPNASASVLAQQETQQLEDTVNESARRYNDAKISVRRKGKELTKLVDKWREMRLENEQLYAMAAASTPDHTRIVELKQAVDDVDEAIKRKVWFYYLCKYIVMSWRSCFM